jgi:ribosomal protein S25
MVKLLSEKEEKLVVRKATLNLRRKYGRSKQITVVERDAFIPNSIEKEIRESLPKRKSILASDLALKYDLRISTVNLLLKQYEEEGLIKILDPTLKLKIYVPSS